LKAIGDASRHKHRRLWPNLVGNNLAEALRPLAQVAPRTKNLALRHRDEFVPRFGVQPAGSAGVVEGNIVLHRLKAREFGRETGELFPLPIFFEPAAIVPVHVEVDDE